MRKWVLDYDAFKQVNVYRLMEDWDTCIAEVRKDRLWLDGPLTDYEVIFLPSGRTSVRRFKHLKDAKEYAQRLCDKR